MERDDDMLPISTKRQDPRYQRLIAATRDAAKGGYENVSMRELASRCHLSLRTIYRRFCRSKDQLVAEAHLDGLESFSDRLKQRPPADASPRRRVIEVLQSLTRALEADEIRSRTMLRAFYSPEQLRGGSRSLVASAFSDIVELALTDDLDESRREAVVSTLAHVLNSAILAWLNGDRSVAWVNAQVEMTACVVLGPLGIDPNHA